MKRNRMIAVVAAVAVCGVGAGVGVANLSTSAASEQANAAGITFRNMDATQSQLLLTSQGRAYYLGPGTGPLAGKTCMLIDNVAGATVEVCDDPANVARIGLKAWYELPSTTLVMAYLPVGFDTVILPNGSSVTAENQAVDFEVPLTAGSFKVSGPAGQRTVDIPRVPAGAPGAP